jgi:hypothetical protein
VLGEGLPGAQRTSPIFAVIFAVRFAVRCENMKVATDIDIGENRE